jgi:hypothetical protein
VMGYHSKQFVTKMMTVIETMTSDEFFYLLLLFTLRAAVLQYARLLLRRSVIS